MLWKNPKTRLDKFKEDVEDDIEDDIEDAIERATEKARDIVEDEIALLSSSNSRKVA